MRIELPFPEALALATAGGPLPPIVRRLRCSGSTISAELDLGELPTDSFLMKLAIAAAGTVAVTAELSGFSAGIATFAITVSARGLPAHRLIPFLLNTVNDAIDRSSLPGGLIEVAAGTDEPVVRIDVQQAVRERATGIILTDLRLVDSVFVVQAVIGTVRLSEPAGDQPVPPHPGEPAAD
ncbi:MAG TPA: hypothetical protein VIL55_08015 [Naasia sp.]